MSGQRRPQALAALLAFGAALAVPSPVGGQQLDPRLLASRVGVIDRMIAPFPSAAAASGFVARFAGADTWAPFSACIGEQTERDEWSAALDEARRLLDDAADQLVPLPPRSPLLVSTTSLPVRDVVHERLSRLPPTITASYRKQADAAAGKLIEEWRTTGSAQPLRRMVRELAISSLAREAADILGDLAFEAGDFEDAFAWWNTRHVDLDEDRSVRRRAKRVLARIFQGRFDDAEQEIEHLRQEHPGARGALAGRAGAYTEILAHWLAIRRTHRNEDRAKPWPCFAGSATRNRVFGEHLSPGLWNEGHAWRAALPGTSLPGGKHGSRDAVLPVINDGQVFVASRQEIVAHELATGEVRFRYRQPDAPGDKAPAGFAGTTLHAAPGCLYAAGPTALLCLDTGPDVPAAGRLRWRVSARDPDEQPATVASAPLVADGRVFVVVKTIDGLRTRHYLACHTMRRGARLWCVPLCEGVGEGQAPLLLTWAGDRLVCATHQGQVIAIDPLTGRPLWAVRYTSEASGTNTVSPLPAVYDAGRVIVAPRDGPRLLCIESATGRVAWELPKDNVSVSSILGIAGDIVVFTTRQGIEAVDVHTGGGERHWRQPSGGRSPTAGRGILAGPLVYWPTHDPRLPVRTLTIAGGSPFADDFELRFDPSRFHALPAGNFAFGQRSLAIATRDELVVFTPRHVPGRATE